MTSRIPDSLFQREMGLYGHLLRVCLTLTLAVESAACAGSRASLSVRRISEGEDAAAVLEREKAPETIRPLRNFHGHPGRRRPAALLIQSKEAWDALWPQGFQPPEVDFSREMILAAFAGEKPGVGHSLTFGGAFFADGGKGRDLRVHLLEKSPPPGCFHGGMFPRTIRPALIVSFPRHAGRVAVTVTQHSEKTCLIPPKLSLDCQVTETGAAPFRNALPARALPAVGQSVRCTASSESGARTKVWLFSAPPDSALPTSPASEGLPTLREFEFRPDVPGEYLAAAEAARGDGFVSRETARIAAGIQLYEVTLEEDEPEGLLGHSLEVRRLEPDDGEEEPDKENENAPDVGGDSASDEAEEDDAEDASDEERCTAASPQKWCAALSSGGYAERIVFPAAMGGEVCIAVTRRPDSPPPAARLKISLAGFPLWDTPLTDGEEDCLAVLNLREAKVTPAESVKAIKAEGK